MISGRHSHNKYVLPIIFLSLILVVLFSFVILESNNLHKAQDTLSATRTELATTQANLTQTQANLAQTQAGLANTQTELETTQNKLTQSQGDLANTRVTLAATQANLTQSQEDLASKEAELKLSQDSVSSVQSTLSNLQTNYDRMAAGYAYVFKDPTYAQMKAFVAADKTDKNTYNAATYDCVNFSNDLITDAAKQGIRAAFVSIDFPSSGHAIVAFNTTDKGLVYIEPQDDDEVNLRVGARYYQCEIAPPGSYFIAPSYNDTVVRIVVIW
jgi:hypothetical protein